MGKPENGRRNVRLWTAILTGLILFCGTTDLSAGEAGAELARTLRQTIGPVEEIRQACQTGSLIFSRGDCLAVRIYTASGYTHVATVVCESGEPFVYDSMNGTGVRKLTLEEYLDRQAPDDVQLFHPVREFSVDETADYRAYLESQLGRPYSVKHHVTGNRCEGLHCAEYVTDALVAVDWLKAENPVKVSPASLAEGITSSRVYLMGERVELPFEAEPIPEPSGRCARLWQETKDCTVRCCQQLSRWVLCR